MRRRTRALAPVVLVAVLAAGCGIENAGVSANKNPAGRDVLAASRNAPIPEFTHPADITNRYFPLSKLGGYDLVGREEGKPYEAKIVVLDRTRPIEWAGGTTEALVARHRSYLEGELIEVAVDYYAQGDDGSVWYFGEDVTYFKNGRVTSHEGSWLTGRNGALPGLLIPADPSVHEVFWSEDVAAEQIQERNQVTDLNDTVETPGGSRDDGLLIRAFQHGRATEEKTYVPSLGVVREVGSTSTLRLVR